MPATFGFELSDAGFLAASCEGNDVRPLAVTDRSGATDWPGFAQPHIGIGMSRWSTACSENGEPNSRAIT